MKILFIGGNGNISWYCVQKALDVGHEVWELNRSATLVTRRDIQAEVHKLTGDMRNHEEMRALFLDKHFDIICDFICYNEEHAMFDVDLFYGKCEQFIFISSVVVYERKAVYLPFKEDCPQWPDEVIADYPYAGTKILAERVFLNAFQNKNFPITIVRPAYTYDTIVPIYIGHNCFTAPQMYRDGYPILIAGDGTTLFAFTHSSDLAAALSGLFMNDRAIGEAFHITTDRWLTWLDAMGILAETLGVKSPRFLRIPSEDILKMEVPVSANMGISFLGKAFYFQKMWCDIYDNRKIKTAVPGWQAVKTFEQGIGETISWLDEKDVRRRINPDLQALLLDLTKKYS